MATITKETELAAPVERVWEKLTDLEGYSDWLSIHSGYPEGVPSELTPGTSFKEAVTVMGMPGEVTWTVKQHEPQTLLEFEGAGPMGVKLRNAYRLEPNGDGTKLTCESEFGGEALAAMEGPLSAASEQALTQSLASLESQLT
jgi:uncharacterized protein YndB with AHSA1/START domain